MSTRRTTAESQLNAPIELRARFRDGDPVGILFFARAYELAHDAYEEWVLKLGYSYREWFENETWGVPFRKTECEHLRPIRPGDLIEVKTAIESMSETTFVSTYEMTVDGQTVCTVRLAHVFVDRKTKKKISIPSDVRRRLEAYQLKGLNP